MAAPTNPPPDRPAAQPAPAPAPERPARTQVLVAALGLAGVLGAALLSNWDKVFGPASPPAATRPATAPGTTQGANSAAVSGVTGNVTIQIGDSRPPSPPIDLAGRWETAPVTSAYNPGWEFALTFDFEPQGATLLGTVTTRTLKPYATTASRPIVDGRIDGATVSFQTQFDSVAGSTSRPSIERYVGRIEGNEIRLRRANDVPTGGLTEQFVARRP